MGCGGTLLFYRSCYRACVCLLTSISIYLHSHTHTFQFIFFLYSSSSTPSTAARPKIDPSTLSDEQKLALARWQALSEEQRKDLTAKYGEARATARQRKMETAYRPKTRQAPATDYDKWDAWAKSLPPEEGEDESSGGARVGNGSSGRSSVDLAAGANTLTTSIDDVLADTSGKIEAFAASFLFAMVCTQLVLPLSVRFTFTKQVLFGAAVVGCFLADRHGLALECFGFMWGGSLGALLFAVVRQSGALGMLVGGLVGAWSRSRRQLD